MLLGSYIDGPSLAVQNKHDLLTALSYDPDCFCDNIDPYVGDCDGLATLTSDAGTIWK